MNIHLKAKSYIGWPTTKLFSNTTVIFLYTKKEKVNYKSCIYIKGHLLDRVTFQLALITITKACHSAVRCYISLDQFSLMTMNILVHITFCFSRVSEIREYGVVHGAESSLLLGHVHKITSPAF